MGDLKSSRPNSENDNLSSQNNFISPRSPFATSMSGNRAGPINKLTKFILLNEWGIWGTFTSGSHTCGRVFSNSLALPIIFLNFSGVTVCYCWKVRVYSVNASRWDGKFFSFLNFETDKTEQNVMFLNIIKQITQFSHPPDDLRVGAYFNRKLIFSESLICFQMSNLSCKNLTQCPFSSMWPSELMKQVLSIVLTVTYILFCNGESMFHPVTCRRRKSQSFS